MSVCLSTSRSCIYLFIFADLFTGRNSKINVDSVEETIKILGLKSSMSSSCDVTANEKSNNDDIVYC